MRPAVRNIIIIAIIVIVCILFISFIAGRDNESEERAEETPINLTEYADSDTEATLTTKSQITADENFRTVRISITPSERNLQILSGYQETLEREEVFPNNQEAYREFILALKGAGFSKLTEKPIQEDPEVVCPLGRRYYYELEEFGSDPVISTWSTSCAIRNQPFGGNGRTVRRLFQLQIPGYNRFVRSVDI
jgi:hypothetical protein